ncbi:MULTISPECIES: hypothetical protein [unclassified Clostridium]|uniref:hypothetical protein n=1 Tax=Clostridium TaxID=1485 RepID=UPI001C8B7383|nr:MULTISPECIES: hypothetical protein [unclassified Clostridium]MBX9138539.1 hypothetical protein [Clostridium sp. K12(2020)]MBX9145236.1 hypothetical protein [Clostridium sp. K13]MDU2288853.1 hypothetical protein [Clostridium celatum]MDU4325301.1 hypothetical protein [Clostridium celatum]
MSNNIHVNTPADLAKIGNFTKNAIESFENCIVNEHNYLEKVDKNLNNKNNK